MRAIAYSTPGELRLESRNLNEITDSYPELARLGRALGSTSAVLDGEIVAFDEHGRPSFGRCSGACTSPPRARPAGSPKATPVTYMIFDLLWLDGHSLMGLPYTERRERLSELALDGESWQTPEHVVGHGAGAAAGERRAASRGRSSPSGSTRPTGPGQRRASWIKVKSVAPQEFVIGGWLPGKGKRRQDDRRAADRRVRAGRRAALRRPRRERLQRQRAGAPARAARAARRERARRSRPASARRARRVSASPSSSPRSSSPSGPPPGSLRQPSYKGLREDKAGRARSCARSPLRAAGRREAVRREQPVPGAGRQLDDRRESIAPRARRAVVERTRAQALQPREGPLSRRRVRQGRADRVLRRDRACAAAPSRRAGR